MNLAERRLWSLLRRKDLGFRFRRQHPFGPYFIDFFCAEANLAVELDGKTHDLREESDPKRDAYLAAHGVETLRLANSALDDPFLGFLLQIQDRCRARTGRQGNDIAW